MSYFRKLPHSFRNPKASGNGRKDKPKYKKPVNALVEIPSASFMRSVQAIERLYYNVCSGRYYNGR